MVNTSSTSINMKIRDRLNVAGKAGNLVLNFSDALAPTNYKVRAT